MVVFESGENVKINFIKYSKSVEGARFEAAAVLDKHDNPDAAFEDLKKYVDEKLGIKSGAQDFKNNALADAFKAAADSRKGVFAE